MTDSTAAILRQWASDVSLGTIPSGGTSAPAAWSMYLGSEGEAPDNCMTFYDTDGPDDGRGMISGEVVGPDGVQIRFRAVNYPTGWAKANAVRDAIMLAGVNQPYQRRVTISSRNYLIECVVGIGPVLSLGKMIPNNRLNVFTLNCNVRARSLD